VNPYPEAKRVYQQELCVRSFEVDLDMHLRHGWVYSGPELFIMARPVRRDAPAELVVCPSAWWPSSECDTWHVYLFAGDLSKLERHMPFPLPWISFERKNELRFYALGEMSRLANEKASPEKAVGAAAV
jgi:hypothetical protein